jgi:hypothetical protein
VGELEGSVFGYCNTFVVRENNFCPGLPLVDGMMKGEGNLKKEWEFTNYLTF